jgi:hypothetical protein
MCVGLFRGAKIIGKDFHHLFHDYIHPVFPTLSNLAGFYYQIWRNSEGLQAPGRER